MKVMMDGSFIKRFLKRYPHNLKIMAKITLGLAIFIGSLYLLGKALVFLGLSPIIVGTICMFFIVPMIVTLFEI
jgi:hypothetical protein